LYVQQKPHQKFSHPFPPPKNNNHTPPGTRTFSNRSQLCILCHARGRGKQGQRRTSPPVTLPVLRTRNNTSNAGRCSQIAAEPPPTFELAPPRAHAASSAAESASAWCTACTCRSEYANVV